jgi:[acyl-carrier-protein] S-malonyltransferase
MIALLCPGQGSQFVGMGQDLADAHGIVRDTFAEADETLGFSLSRLCWEGPEESLRLTQNAQPAILAHTIAVWRLLAGTKTPAVGIAAGHSLGEFSAYVAAGAIRYDQAVRLVRRRGELMYEAGRVRAGAMAAVLGLDDTAAEDACRTATQASGGIVVPANYNSPGQIVVSGDAESVALLHETAKEAGAKRVLPLNVSGAFHSPLMESAVGGFRDALEDVDIADPAFPIVSNVTAEPVIDPVAARELLVRQLTSPVRWVDSIRALADSGVSAFLEIGPGNVLSGLVRRIDRSLVSRTVGAIGDLETYLGEEG